MTHSCHKWIQKNIFGETIRFSVVKHPISVELVIERVEKDVSISFLIQSVILLVTGICLSHLFNIEVKCITSCRSSTHYVNSQLTPGRIGVALIIIPVFWLTNASLTVTSGNASV